MDSWIDERGKGKEKGKGEWMCLHVEGRFCPCTPKRLKKRTDHVAEIVFGVEPPLGLLLVLLLLLLLLRRRLALAPRPALPLLLRLLRRLPIALSPSRRPFAARRVAALAAAPRARRRRAGHGPWLSS